MNLDRRKLGFAPLEWPRHVPMAYNKGLSGGNRADMTGRSASSARMAHSDLPPAQTT